MHFMTDQEGFLHRPHRLDLQGLEVMTFRE
jgi:hypothetical protein